MLDFEYLKRNKRKIALISALIFLFEALSYLSYYWPNLNLIIFFFLVVLTLIVSWRRLRWGLYLVAAELFFNSMGYIFFIEADGSRISLRIALWLVVMSVWLAKFILNLSRDKWLYLKKYLKLPGLTNFVALAFFLIVGLLVGIFNNGFSDAFFDFNAWLYFALILPYWQIIIESDSDQAKNTWWSGVINIFLAGVFYLVFKSLLFLFLFSHNFFDLRDIYNWTRNYSLGEITAMSGGLYRIFFQSQVFIVLAWIFLLSQTFKIDAWKKLSFKKAFPFVLILSFLASAIILSFSRSFWLASLLVLAGGGLLAASRLGWKRLGIYLATIVSSLFLGFIIVLAVVKFPWPDSQAQFGLSDLSKRADISANESALSSRWTLLEALRIDLKNNFLWGRGFGARLEYRSSDPRVLEQSADGIYSSYAFEWAWLDINLKLGLPGLLAYAWLLFHFFRQAWFNFSRRGDLLSLGLGLSWAALVVVNFFTPYLNHPLGIGFLILSFLFLDNKLCSK